MKKNYYLRGNRWTKKKGKREPSILITNLPLVSVFIIMEDGIISRGVALCSDSDNPDKYIGRWLAHINAVEARDSKKSSKLILRREAISVLNKMSIRDFHCRSEYNPALSQYEKELLGVYDTSYDVDKAPKVQWDNSKAHPIEDVKRAMEIMGKTGIKL